MKHQIESVCNQKGHRFYGVIKSGVAVPAALSLMILLSPILLLVAILVKLSGRGPVLFFQTRVGFRGAQFELIKFRTMGVNAEEDGPQWSSENDARVTKIGHFLRETHLDELPQLWNILRGEMCFIGPRPERPVYHDLLKMQIPDFDLRTYVYPGITGWAQVENGYANSIECSRQKLECDLIYIQRMSPLLDVVILLRTVARFLPNSQFKRKLRETPAKILEANSKFGENFKT